MGQTSSLMALPKANACSLACSGNPRRRLPAQLGCLVGTAEALPGRAAVGSSDRPGSPMDGTLDARFDHPMPRTGRPQYSADGRWWWDGQRWHPVPQPGRSLGRTLEVGIVAGVGAGLVFALFETTMAAIAGIGFFEPFRLIAAIALGPSVLPDSTPLYTVLIAGTLVHVSLSALYGTIFAVSARYIRILRLDLIIATTAFGLAIWIINFYFFSPLLFPWFQSNVISVQFIAHTAVFGMTLGAILLQLMPPSGRHLGEQQRAQPGRPRGPEMDTFPTRRGPAGDRLSARYDPRPGPRQEVVWVGGGSQTAIRLTEVASVEMKQAAHTG
jgi:hypothetical protein